MKSIDEMTPEEIRQEIAERRGWSYVVVSHKYTALPDGKLSEGIPIYGYIFNGGVSYPPDWPASIAAAKELVEEMRTAGIAVAIIYFPDNWESSPVEIKLYQEEGDTSKEKFYVKSTLDTVAICKAWLAWKRSEDK
jgi:hypothetical protein